MYNNIDYIPIIYYRLYGTTNAVYYLIPSKKMTFDIALLLYFMFKTRIIFITVRSINYCMPNMVG